MHRSLVAKDWQWPKVAILITAVSWLYRSCP